MGRKHIAPSSDAVQWMWGNLRLHSINTTWHGARDAVRKIQEGQHPDLTFLFGVPADIASELVSGVKGKFRRVSDHPLQKTQRRLPVTGR